MSKKTSRLISISVIICIFVLLTIFVIIPKLKSNKNEPNEGNAEENNARVKSKPVLVEAEPAFRGKLIVRVSASGQTEYEIKKIDRKTLHQCG